MGTSTGAEPLSASSRRLRRDVSAAQTCLDCGCPVTRLGSRGKQPQRCLVCARERRAKRDRERRAAQPRPRIFCLSCGTELSREGCRGSLPKRCSPCALRRRVELRRIRDRRRGWERKNKRVERVIWTSASWAALRRFVFTRDRWRCGDCGRVDRTGRTLTGHHVQPLTRGGAPFDPINVETLCRSCHGRRDAARADDADSITFHPDVLELVERRAQRAAA